MFFLVLISEEGSPSLDRWLTQNTKCIEHKLFVIFTYLTPISKQKMRSKQSEMTEIAATFQVTCSRARRTLLGE
jgi:hypothetical protein